MLKIVCFGYPRVFLNDLPVTDFVSDKSIAVLLYAALNPGPISRDTLTGMFWGDQPEKKSKASFRSAVYNVRQLVGDYILTDRKSIAINPALPLFIDAVNLAETFSQDGADIEVVREAIRYYVGDFLDGFFISNALEFENWVINKRKEFENHAIKGLNALIEYDEARGDAEAAIDGLRQLVKIDPLNEGTLEKLMLILARSGEFNQAIAQYKLYRTRLDDELDIDPTPKMVSLYNKITRARGLPRNNVPIEATPFIDRPHLIEKITSTILAPHNRMVTLLGIGGVGKTRLAMEAASQLETSFLNGVAYLSLSDLEKIDEEQPEALLLKELTTRLSLENYIGRPTDRVELSDHLFSELKEKELLIVIDNFEHMVGASKVLTKLLQASPHIKFLMTSRERVNSIYEIAIKISGFPLPNEAQQPGADWRLEPVTQLFINAAKRADPTVEWQDVDRESIADIAHVLDGHPLGIELAAGLITVQPSREIAAEIRSGILKLTSIQPDRPHRHQSIEALFNYTWSTLHRGHRNILARLSVFPGSFTAIAAKEVVNASVHDLSIFIQKSLINRITSDHGYRFVFHPLQRQFFSAKLAEQQDEPEYNGYFADYYLDILTSIGADDVPNATAHLEPVEDLPNIRAAWQLILSSNSYVAIQQGLDGLCRYLEFTHVFLEAIEILQQTIRLVDQWGAGGNEQMLLLGKLNTYLARFYRITGATFKATSIIGQSLEQVEIGGDELSLAAAHHEAGILTYDIGKYSQAERHYHEAARILGTLGRVQSQQQIMSNLAYVYYNSGEKEKYAETIEHLINTDIGISNDRLKCQLHNSIAYYYMVEQRFAEALEELELALELAKRVDYRHIQVVLLSNIGEVHYEIGDFAKSESYLYESLKLAESINVLGHLGYSLRLLFLVQHTSERKSEAFETLIEYQFEVRSSGSHVKSILFLDGLARVLFAENMIKDAFRIASFVVESPLTEPWIADHLKTLMSQHASKDQVQPILNDNIESILGYAKEAINALKGKLIA